jgi:hypothetical protein
MNFTPFTVLGTLSTAHDNAFHRNDADRVTPTALITLFGETISANDKEESRHGHIMTLRVPPAFGE